MTAVEDRAKTIFLAALERAPDQLPAFLDEACGDDADVRARVEQLLRSHDALGSIHVGGAPAAIIDLPPVAEAPGTVIGPYKLVEPIGEGGMGTVWLAQQTEPVRRLVAVKLVKAGMDSKQVIARFEAERQALALMDHPNIARVLDAGTTAGRPYFVMDLVKGVPITKYCDEHHLTPRQRLELFLPVCHAVQHAHQKGIIHRDLKPSNVLVALYDGRPVPKVIDFGVAKAAGQPLTDKTLVTGFGAIVGTPEYMSPEQAEINQFDLDTRSDIYSLGVLLYELLVGSPPFTKKDLEKAGLLEMLRVIREREPSKPSTKLSTAEGLPTLAANRGTEPAKLTRLVRGELDWIVMKALEKDRNRRYETANGFATDLQRYLADEPVLACPPSASYRFRKFARRHKAVLVTAAVVSTALILAASISTWQAIRATTAERLADDRLRKETEAHQAEHKQREAAERARQRATENLQLAREAVDRMLTEVGHKDLANVPQMEPLRRALLERAIEFYRRFLQANPDDAGIRMETGLAFQRIGNLYDRLGQYAAAEKTHQDSLRILEQLAAEFPHEPKYERALANVYRTLAGALIHLHRWPDAEQAARQAVARARKLVARFPQDAAYLYFLASCLTNLDVPLVQMGRLDEGEAALLEALPILEKFVAVEPKDPVHVRALVVTYSSLAGLLARKGQPRTAEKTRRRAIQLEEGLVSEFPGNPEYGHGVAHNRLALGLLLKNKRQFPDAQEQFQAAVDSLAKIVADYPKTAQFRASLVEAQSLLAALFRDTARQAEAEPLYRRAFQNWMILVAETPGRPYLGGVLTHLIELLLNQGKHDEAETIFSQCLDVVAALLESKAAVYLRVPAWFLAISPKEKQRDPRPSVELARRAVDRQPKNNFLWNTLGAAHYRAGNWKEAIAALERSMELRDGGGDAFDWFFLSLAHGRLGTKVEARRWYQLAVDQANRGPNYPELGRFHAEAAALLGLKDKMLWDEGLKHRSRAIELRDAGRAQEAAEAFRQAIEVLEQLVNELPVPRDYRHELGRCYLSLWHTTNKPKERADIPTRALPHWQRLAEEFPDDAWVLSNLGETYALMGEWRKAVELQTRAIALKGDLWVAWHRRGWAYQNLQEWKEAIADQTRALELNPSYPAMHWRRGGAFAGLKQWDQALTDFEQAIEFGAKAPKVWVDKAGTHAQLKQPDKAVEALRIAITKGFRGIKELQEREDLAPLRERDDFKKLLEELKTKK
jgi:serine/threonine protein kinase/predicted Zn-dependent protease